MGKKSRTKGKTGELEVVHLFKDAGWPDAERAIKQYQKSSFVDIDNVEPYFVQVKREARPPRAEKILNEIEAEAGVGSGFPVLFQRGNGGRWVVSMFADEFFALADAEQKYWKSGAEVERG